MWARGAAERTPAKEYLTQLLGGATPTDKLKDAVRADASLTPLRKLVALELLDTEIRKGKRDLERKVATTQAATTLPAK